jgi:hypothetical protein
MLLTINSIVGLFKLIITVLFFFLLIRWISTLFFTEHRKQGRNTSPENHNNEGETTITVTNKKNKTNPAKEGEYVDFEELE